MTERLYLFDSKLFCCEAAVTACSPTLKGWAVTLSRSVFFPEKGGQPCDLGRIGDASVVDCQEEDGELIHYTSAPLSIGCSVEAAIDEKRRMDIMRQHTGEHLLSFFAWKEFSAVNVGFHCALDYATLDLDKPLSAEELCRMETLTNAYALKNVPVTAEIYPTEDDLREITLRKHSEGLTAPIRVVTIEGADSCTCCAPHVKHTGEIGQIKIVGAMAYKGGMRLTFLCGERALRYAQGLHNDMDRLARLFSTSFEQVPAAVIKQGEELSDTKKTLRQAEIKLDSYLGAELKRTASVIRGVQLIVTDVKGVDGKRLRSLAQSTLEGRSLSILFAPCGEQVNYILASKGLKLDMGECIQAVNAAMNGKGGGRGELAQGSARLGCDLCDTVEQLRHYFERLLG